MLNGTVVLQHSDTSACKGRYYAVGSSLDRVGTLASPLVGARDAGLGDASVTHTLSLPRATARVPTPLHTTPTLTMTHGESRSFRPHSKGGGGVERGGDPCGRPGGCNVSGRESPSLRDLKRLNPRRVASMVKI